MTLPQFNLNCTNLTIDEIKTINLARSVSGLTCALMTLAILCLLLWYRSYKTTLRRLFLVFTVDKLAIEVLLAANIEHYFAYEGQGTVCSVLGFLIQWTGSMTYWCSLAIVLVLATAVVQTMRGKSTKWKVSTEFVLISSVIILPLLQTWPPFLTDSYGLDFAYCWIKEKDSNCSMVGESDRKQFFIISQTTELVCVLVTIVLAILYGALRYRHKDVGTTQITTLLRQTLLLMAFLVSHWLWNVLAYFIYNLSIEEYTQWLCVDSIPVPISYLIVPLGFIVHLYTVKHYGCCLRCCGERESKGDRQNTAEDQTRPTSHPLDVRSDTYWSTPYTNQFTSVGSSERELLLKTNTSYTGYGSHDQQS